MVGILCSLKKERTITEYLHKLFKPLVKGKNVPVIVFSMPNINLLERTVFGSLISEEKIKPMKTALPMLIFNFAMQYTKSDIKKLRSLIEIEGISLINAANQYNQLSIMEMLISGSKTKNYVLPYMDYDDENIYFRFSGIDNFLLKPEKRADVSRIIYGKQSDFGFELYNRYGSKSCHRLDIESVIHSNLRGKKWLLLKTPDLVAYRNKLFIVRVYMQKRFNGEWDILSKSIISHNEILHEKPGKKIDTASLNIINYINCFIPDLGICFIDFVLDIRTNPYFLSLGGWNSKLLSKKQSKDVLLRLCKNIMEYVEAVSCSDCDKETNALFRGKKEGDYVG